MKNTYCAIITIGDELLIGQTIDTNSAWIAKQLNNLGIQVKRRVAVGDLAEEIIAVLNQERKDCDLVILTGGLGPTSDDITKPVLCTYFNAQLIENKEVSLHIRTYFEKRKRPMPESNIVQAWVPDNCEVLFNEAGTAPGMLFRNKGQIIISLPGVPNEMEHIMEKNVLQILKDNFDTPDYIHKTLITSGEGESFIAERLRDFERALPENIKLAYLPNINIVKLRLTANDVPTAILDAQFEKLKNLLANIYVIDSDLELEEVIALLLKKNKKTVSVAESCTGGNISSRITSVTGASAFFKGGVVPYTIEIKESVLGVDPGIIAQHTVVSRETVIDMAEKCLHKFGSDYALSVSGYLEKNDHGNVVWIGWSNGIQSGAKKIVAPYDRKKNTQFVSNTALNMLRLFIIENP